MTADSDLMDAVIRHDLGEVDRLLTSGADPNWRRDIADEDEWQPYSPLRMVMFRISDSTLGKEDLVEFAGVAELLLAHGADPRPAMEIAELRYGPFDPYADDSPFQAVWSVVARAVS